MKPSSLVFLFLFALGFGVHTSCAATSALWGNSGELWSPQSRLPDFSYSGYQRGEQAIPNPAVTASVTDFGAVGDGVADDTLAFQNAIAATANGAILVPAGRYKITDFVTINKSNLVLRGEGADRSILYFPNTLTDVLPNWGETTTGQPTSNYSWGGGFVRINGSLGQSDRASVVAPFALRGDSWIPLSTVSGLSVGQWITVKVSDDAARTLATWLYNGDSGTITSIGTQVATQIAKITQIDTTGKRIQIDAPLRFDIQSTWTPKVQTFTPNVTNSGVEDLGFEFPVTPYGGHFTELGYNALEISNAAHCWIRRIRIAHCDSGVFLKGAFCTLSDVVITSARAPSGVNRGHHGISAYGSDNLVEDFDFQVKFIHDISVESARAAGNVFQNGKGQDLSLDHHKRAPYANLFVNIDCGAGTRVWSSGGGSNLGKNTAGWATFWNMTATGNMGYPPTAFGPQASMNIVGLKTTQAQVTSPTGKWFETMSPQSLVPQNIYAAQRIRRLGIPEVSHAALTSIPYPENSVLLQPNIRVGGLPATAGTYTVLWRKLSGLGNVWFADSQAASTTAAFDTRGTYVLEIAVTAGGRTATAEVTVNLGADPNPLIVEIIPEADTYARSGIYATNNYGNETSVFVKTTSGDFTRHAYLRFDLASLIGKRVFGADLQIHTTTPPTTTGTRAIEARFVDTDGWGETTLTWNNKPATGSLLATWVPSASGVELINVGAGVISEQAGDQHLSIGLIVTAQLSSDTFVYGSREGASPSRPRLRVEIAKPPIAEAGIASGTEDTALDIDLRPLVTVGSTPTAGLTFTVANATNGIVWITSGYIARFTPNANHTGPAAFDFTVSDGLQSSTAALALTFAPVPDAPVATTLAIDTPLETAIEVDLRTLVSDPETPAAFWHFTLSAVANGTVSLLGDGYTARFTPAFGFAGPASFSFGVNDRGIDSRLVFSYDFEAPDALIGGMVTDASGQNRPVSIRLIGTGTAALDATSPAELGANGTQSLRLNESGANFSRMERSITPTDLSLSNASWTFATWIKRATRSTDDFVLYIGDGDGHGGNADELELYCGANSDTLQLRHFNTANATDISLSSSATVPINEWHHAAITFDRTGTNTGTVRLYLDGILVGTKTDVTWALKQNVPLILGGIASTSGANVSRHFNGWLDECALFSGALSAAEITSLASQSVSTFGGFTASNVVTVQVVNPAVWINVTHGGSATANQQSANANESAAKAFDGLSGTKWYSGSASAGPWWLRYQFPLGGAYAISRYSITSANDVPNRDPRDWQFQGSHDGTNWTTLDTRTGQSFASRLLTKTFTIVNPTAYAFYRLHITANFSGGSGFGLQIAEFSLFHFGEPTPLEHWRMQNFGTPSDIGAASNMGDFDNDGAANFLEFALGADPAIHDPTQMPETAHVNGRLQITFYRARPDVIYIVQASSDLQTWIDIATNPGTVGQFVTVQDIVATGTRFIRLQVKPM